MQPLFLLLALIFGLLLGSFFNVLIWRLPRNESIVLPGSHCPECNVAIPPWLNKPLSKQLRERNFQHFLRYTQDRDILERYGLKLFEEKYHACRQTLI